MRLTLQFQLLVLLYQIYCPLILLKTQVQKVLDLERDLSKGYNPPNRKLISRDILDVIHEQNMKRNLSMIRISS